MFALFFVVMYENVKIVNKEGIKVVEIFEINQFMHDDNSASVI